MESKDKKLEQLMAAQKAMPFISIADAVMSEIERPSVKKRNGILVDMTRLFPKVAAACLLIIFALLLRTYLLEGSLNAEALLGISELTIDEAYTFYD